MSLFRTPVFDASGIGCNFHFEIRDDGGLKGWLLENQDYTYSSGGDLSIYYVTNFQTTFPNNQWHHFAFTHVGWGGGNTTVNTHGVANVFVNGKYLAPTGTDTRGFWRNKLIDAAEDNLCFGGGPTGSATNIGSFKGYMDGIRVSDSIRYTGTSTSEWGCYDQPTRAYGAFGSEKPDVGTITLTATGSGDYTWSEVAAGTALPGTLAVGSTTHSGSGNSRTHTATITGAFTSSVSSNTTTSGILLKAQNDADATKAITLGTDGGGYDGIGITQNISDKPVLFNARRYFGSGIARDISDFGFQPDFVWIKSRGETRSHMVWDSVTNLGGSPLVPDTNAQSQASAQGHISKFNADGFSLATAGTNLNVNNPNHNFIAWAWKAGGSPSADGKKIVDGVESNAVSGTDYGAISGTTPFRNVRQSINTAGGFNITKFRLGDIGSSGSFEGSWFKHGLGSSATDNPDFVILKNISQAQSWITWHSGVGAWSAANSVGYLDTNVAFTGSNLGNFLRKTTTSGMPTGDGKVWIDQRSVFAAGVDEDFVCYTWKAMAGVSAFGTYEGNQSGHTVTTGFAPKCVIIKNIDNANHWHLYDTLRGGTLRMYLNEPEGEPAVGNSTTIVFSTTNGFTFPSAATSPYINANGDSYVYAAFA